MTYKELIEKCDNRCNMNNPTRFTCPYDGNECKEFIITLERLPYQLDRLLKSEIK